MRELAGRPAPHDQGVGRLGCCADGRIHLHSQVLPLLHSSELEREKGPAKNDLACCDLKILCFGGQLRCRHRYGRLSLH